MESSAKSQELEAYKAKIKINQTDLMQLVGQAVNAKGECPEDFSCNICTQLVFDPEECSQCDHMFCKACIQQWFNKGKSECPLCKINMTPQPLNRILKKFLDQTVLKGCPNYDCSLSKEEMTYERLNSHLQKDCGQITVRCPLNGCTANFLRKNAGTHFEQQCIAVVIRCEQCEEEVQKCKKNEHNCFKSMKKVINLQAQQILELTQKLEQLSKIVQQGNQPKPVQPPVGIAYQPQPRPTMAQKPINPMSQTFSAGFSSNVIELRGGRKITKAGPNQYKCASHGNPLQQQNNTNGGYRCDACEQLFQDIAIQKSKPVDSLSRFECRLCDMDICQYCVEDPSRIHRKN